MSLQDMPLNGREPEPSSREDYLEQEPSHFFRDLASTASEIVFILAIMAALVILRVQFSSSPFPNFWAVMAVPVVVAALAFVAGHAASGKEP